MRVIHTAPGDGARSMGTPIAQETTHRVVSSGRVGGATGTEAFGRSLYELWGRVPQMLRASAWGDGYRAR